MKFVKEFPSNETSLIKIEAIVRPGEIEITANDQNGNRCPIIGIRDDGTFVRYIYQPLEKLGFKTELRGGHPVIKEYN